MIISWRELFTLLLCFAGMIAIKGQDYQVDYVADIKTLSGKRWSGATSLVFNDSSAAFIHTDWPTKNDLFERDGKYHTVVGDSEGMKIYTNLKSREFHHKDHYMTPDSWNFIFIDSIPQIDWTITDEQKFVSNMNVIKARGAYGGRDYTAWFAPSFPVPFGPYHFGGLPGLILEITSDDGLVTYTFDGYHDRIQDERFTVTPPVDGKYATKEEFEKFIISSLLHVETLSTSTMTVTHGIAHPDYVIIKNRYTTIRDYKRERGY